MYSRRRVRHRITRASDSFATIRSLSSPDVPWDEVRARVHWSVSTERRAALRQRRPAYGWTRRRFSSPANSPVIRQLSGTAAVTSSHGRAAPNYSAFTSL